jgi:hypothetical protein
MLQRGALGGCSPAGPTGFIASVIGASVLLSIWAMVKEKA